MHIPKSLHKEFMQNNFFMGLIFRTSWRVDLMKIKITICRTIFWKLRVKVSDSYKEFLSKILKFSETSASAAKPPVAPQAPECTPKNCAPTPSVLVDAAAIAARMNADSLWAAATRECSLKAFCAEVGCTQAFSACRALTVWSWRGVKWVKWSEWSESKKVL